MNANDYGNKEHENWDSVGNKPLEGTGRMGRGRRDNGKCLWWWELFNHE